MLRRKGNCIYRGLSLDDFDDPRSSILLLLCRWLGSETNDVKICQLLVGRGQFRSLLIESGKSYDHLDAIIRIFLLFLLRSIGIPIVII